MNILVVAATQLELDAIDALKMPYGKFLSKKPLGVGQVATTYHLLSEIEHQRPDLIIQIGIAGTFSSTITLGEAFVIETEYMPDMGVEENGIFQSIFEMRLLDNDQLPFSNRKLINPHKTLIEKTELLRANAISVNEITTSKKRIDYYINTYSPELESMEGAAFHYCCLMKEIPFVQIRGVSNYIGERDKKNWKIETALHRVCSSVQQLIDNI